MSSAATRMPRSRQGVHPRDRGRWAAHHRLHRQRVRQRLLRAVDERRANGRSRPSSSGRTSTPAARCRLVHCMRTQALSHSGHGRAVPAQRGRGVPGNAGCWFDIDALARYAEKVQEPKYRCDFIGGRGRGEGRASPRARTGLDPRLGRAGEGARVRALHATWRPAGARTTPALTVIDLTNMNICRRAARQDRPRPARRAGPLPRALVQHRPHRGRDGRGLRGAGHHLPARRQAGAHALPEALPPRPGRPPRLQAEHHLRVPDHDQDAPAHHQPAWSWRSARSRSRTSRWRRSWSAKTFVRQDTLPSPRAAEGLNDDRVMSLAGALEMYRRYGSHPLDVRTSRKRRKREYGP